MFNSIFFNVAFGILVGLWIALTIFDVRKGFSSDWSDRFLNVSKNIITLSAFIIILYQQVSDTARFRYIEVGHETTLPSEGNTPEINVSVRDFLTIGKYV
jgi:hypothetical protein